MIINLKYYRRIYMSNEISSLITETPEDGYQLAVQLSRKAISTMMPDLEIRKKMYQDYIGDARNITHESEVVAIHLHTLSQSIDYMKEQLLNMRQIIERLC